MKYVYIVKFNISLTHLDMYTSSTEPPPPPGPSSTAGNELLRVVCRLIIHIGYHFMHYIFNSYTTWEYYRTLQGKGVLFDILQYSTYKFAISSRSQTWHLGCSSMQLAIEGYNNSSVHILLSPAYSMQGIC